MSNEGASLTEILTTLEALEAIEDEWRELLRVTKNLAPNSDPTRFRAIVEGLDGASPHVVTFRDDAGRLTGLILGRHSRVRGRVRVGYLDVPQPALESLSVAHCGLVSDGKPGTDAAVAGFLSRALRVGDFDHIMLNRVAAECPITERIAASHEFALAPEPHWVVRLTPGSFDESLAHHSAKHRRNLRNYDRKLDRSFDGGCHLRVVTGPDEVEDLLHRIAAISSQTYQSALGVGVADDALTRSILQAEARAGRLRGYVLEGERVSIAFQLGVLYGETYFCTGRGYLPEHRNLRPGTLLFIRMIRDLCEVGAHTIDLGIGEADYKKVFGTSFVSERIVHLYGRGARARTAWALAASAGWARERAHAASQRFGLYGRIKRVWRRELEKR